MARKQIEKSVATSEGDMTFMLTAMDGITSTEMSLKLTQLFGPHIVGVVTAMDSNKDDDASKHVGEFFTKLNRAEFTEMRKSLLKGAQAYRGDEFVTVDDAFLSEAFSGHPGSLMSLLFAALKLNFANFFDDLGLKGVIAKLGSKAKAAMSPAMIP